MATRYSEPELSGSSAALLVVACFASAAVGFAVASWGGALVAGLLGLIVPAVGISLRKFRQTHRRLDGAATALRGLPPEQALQMLSIASSQGKVTREPTPLRSEVLASLEQITATAAGDPEVALVRVRELVEEHPRSPAVHAELARRLLAVEQPSQAARALSRALALALDGGMNPMAAKLFEEFGAMRDELDLASGHLQRLARVLSAQGDTEGAQWVREQLPEP